MFGEWVEMLVCDDHCFINHSHQKSDLASLNSNSSANQQSLSEKYLTKIDFYYRDARVNLEWLERDLYGYPQNSYFYCGSELVLIPFCSEYFRFFALRL